MGASLNLQSRRALLKQFAPQYREASPAQKRVLLDTFVQATGYHRRYGMWLLNHEEEVLHAPAYKRASRDATGSPTRALPGLARCQPHLRQTAHPFSSHACRSPGAS
ncbi:MAG: hypothetical protein ACJ8CB_16425 [Ktedonobacteraceae bacterium]